MRRLLPERDYSRLGVISLRPQGVGMRESAAADVGGGDGAACESLV